MKSYIWITFAIMGWSYYELSGGADFEPEGDIAIFAQVQEIEETELVTRAASPSLLSVSSSNILTSSTTPEAAQIVPVIAPAPQTAPAVAVVEQPVVAPVIEAKLDLREVSGNRVNMRMGPSTNFEVITTLDGGTALEVLEISDDGWANVSVLGSGIEGWMAERLLSDPKI